MSASNPLDIQHAEALARLERRLARAPQLLRPYTRYLAEGQGKGLRARALLASAADEAGHSHPDAVACAAAIEQLHLATLVHDDIMDDAPYRRGRESLQQRFGRRRAVICGDWLMADSLEQVGDIVWCRRDQEGIEPALLSGYLSRIALGELRQTAANGRLDLGALEYLRIIAGKTAALFEASCHIGALLAERSPADRALYRRIGHYIGMIFQLNDDCLDFESTQHQAGKATLADIDQAVVTLPLIHTLAADPALARSVEGQTLERVEGEEEGMAKPQPAPALAQTLTRAVLAGPGIARTRRLADRYERKGLATLTRLREPGPEARRRLAELLQLANRRLQ